MMATNKHRLVQEYGPIKMTKISLKKIHELAKPVNKDEIAMVVKQEEEYLKQFERRKLVTKNKNVFSSKVQQASILENQFNTILISNNINPEQFNFEYVTKSKQAEIIRSIQVLAAFDFERNQQVTKSISVGLEILKNSQPEIGKMLVKSDLLYGADVFDIQKTVTEQKQYMQHQLDQLVFGDCMLLDKNSMCNTKLGLNVYNLYMQADLYCLKLIYLELITLFAEGECPRSIFEAMTMM
ncbi:Hypothetical_protein [Hexamita inflata]|uniref:Hypothetical_protein n=1 Tax=Hexamita inflata TaxID=28002 RepID=A0AA86U3K6_9EUKA|nr:Hypothetical protein HINF_LOCUS17328 [Hexamita inflata]